MQLKQFPRQFAAILFASTLALEIMRISNDIDIPLNSNINTLSNIMNMFYKWILMIHFIYFQLPIQSRFLPFAHSLSFVAANCIPMSYLLLLSCKPNIEQEHMDEWELSWQVIIIRLLVIYILPIIFHALDLVSNQHILIISYSEMTKQTAIIWTSISFGILYLLYELFIGFESDPDFLNMKINISFLVFMRIHKIIMIIGNIFAYIILHFLIFRHSFNVKRTISRATVLDRSINTSNNIKVN